MGVFNAFDIKLSKGAFHCKQFICYQIVNPDEKIFMIVIKRLLSDEGLDVNIKAFHYLLLVQSARRLGECVSDSAA